MDKKKREKKIVVVWDKGLTPEKIRTYEQDHPGYKLSFELRHPELPLVISAVMSMVSIIMVLIFFYLIYAK